MVSEWHSELVVVVVVNVSDLGGEDEEGHVRGTEVPDHVEVRPLRLSPRVQQQHGQTERRAVRQVATDLQRGRHQQQTSRLVRSQWSTRMRQGAAEGLCDAYGVSVCLCV